MPQLQNALPSVLQCLRTGVQELETTICMKIIKPRAPLTGRIR